MTAEKARLVLGRAKLIDGRRSAFDRSARSNARPLIVIVALLYVVVMP